MLNLDQSRTLRVAAQVLLCMAIVLSVGCGPRAPRLQWVPTPVSLTPVANIAEGVRVENWSVPASTAAAVAVCMPARSTCLKASAVKI